MTFSNSLQQLYKDHHSKTIAEALITLLLAVGLIIAIICVVRYRHRKRDPKSNARNTIELNEEEFKDHIDLVKKGEPSYMGK